MICSLKTDSRTEKKDSLHVSRIRWFAWIMAAAWVLVLSISYAWYYVNEHRETETIARAEARAAFGRDMLYRRWASSHGGVYVPITATTQPNPYLSHIPDRDIITPSGKSLTLINPAYMTRQVYEFAHGLENVGRGHLTSLNPLRPENAPDPWELKALKAFEKGVVEVFEVQDLDGKPHMRLMRPFVTDAPCLKCHAVQGYRVGDIRGGISVSIPIQPLMASAHQQIKGNAVTHSVLLILGCGMIWTGSRYLVRSSRIVEENEQRYRTVADFTSDWEYWIAPDGSFRYVSPSCETICGYTPADFYADPHLMTRIIHPEDLDLYTDHRHRMNAQGTPEAFDFRIYNKNGECHWISHVCRTVYDAAGQSLGQRASNRDISDRKKAEEEIQYQAVMLEEEVAERQQAQEELAVKQQQLEVLNQSLEMRVNESVAEIRLKDQMLIQQGRLAAMGEMIHNIAHQWRQPLNNIALIVQNLQLTFMTDNLTQAEMDKEVANVMDVVMHMSRTIDDFRNFFRSDKEKRIFDVRKTVENALEFVGAIFSNCNIQVDLSADEDVCANGYQNEYAQVVLNILGNARDVMVERKIVSPRIIIKIVKEGGRTIVTVTDNGGGIDENVLPKIFDPYFTTKEQGKGTGIGLYMSKAIIVQNMDGKLTARNVGDGAEFRIEV